MRRTTKGIPLPNLSRIRKSRSLSRRAVADAVGIDYTTLWRLETGKTGATVEVALLLSEHYGMPLEDLRKNMHA